MAHQDVTDRKFAQGVVRRQDGAARIAEYLAHSLPFECCPDNLRAREPGFSILAGHTAPRWVLVPAGRGESQNSLSWPCSNFPSAPPCLSDKPISSRPSS